MHVTLIALISLFAAPPSPAAAKGLERAAEKVGGMTHIVAAAGGLEIHGEVFLHSQIEELDAVAAKHGATNHATLGALALKALVQTAEQHAPDHSRKALAAEEARIGSLAKALGLPAGEIREALHPLSHRRILAMRIAMSGRSANPKNPNLPGPEADAIYRNVVRENFLKSAIRAYQDASRAEARLIRENWTLTAKQLAEYERVASSFDDPMIADLAQP